MGNGVSNASLDSRRAEWSIPSWCLGVDSVAVSPEISRLVQESWSAVMHSSSPSFQAAHAHESALTPLTFFYDTFYTHLFSWCPEIKPMFKRGIRQQGQMLANVIKFIVENIGVNDSEFKSNLTMLAKVHNGRGITANHYSVMGMTLIHTIRSCIGDTHFTEAHRHAWIVVYSRMMIVMIPVVVSGETIAEDYLVTKAEAARASQSFDPNIRKSAWQHDKQQACPINHQSTTKEGSQCTTSKKNSLKLKESPLMTEAGSPQSSSPARREKVLILKLSVMHSSRTSVSSICALATSDTED